jgi:hypothetical protein
LTHLPHKQDKSPAWFQGSSVNTSRLLVNYDFLKELQSMQFNANEQEEDNQNRKDRQDYSVVQGFKDETLAQKY